VQGKPLFIEKSERKRGFCALSHLFKFDDNDDSDDDSNNNNNNNNNENNQTNYLTKK
jgi:hypothetical protein